jgi:hypothetical protein
MCECNSTFGNGLGMMFEPAELPLDTLLASSTRHPNDGGTGGPPETAIQNSLVTLSSLYLLSCFVLPPWVANRMARTDMLLGMGVCCVSD